MTTIDEVIRLLEDVTDPLAAAAVNESDETACMLLFRVGTAIGFLKNLELVEENDDRKDS